MTRFEPGKTPDVGAAWVENIKATTRIPTQLRLPEIGEEIAAIGFPTIPNRDCALVMHVGTVEALPTDYGRKQRFIQVSFQSGGGLSGGCLIDKAGYALGIMVENVFMGGFTEESVATGSPPVRPYGQAVPIEYFDDMLPDLWCRTHCHIGTTA